MILSFEINLASEAIEQINQKLRKEFPSLASWSFRCLDSSLFLEFPDELLTKEQIEKKMKEVYPETKLKEGD